MSNLINLPTKTVVMLDAAASIAILEKANEMDTSASFKDVMLLRSHISRIRPGYRLKQTMIEGGYRLKLEYDQA